MDFAYVLRVAASKFPHRHAVLFRDQVLTFGELDQLIDRTAAALATQGLAGRTVASLLFNEPSTIATYLGLARIGAVSVPINTRLTLSEQRYIIEDAQASALVVDRDFIESGLTLCNEDNGLEQLLVSNGSHPDAVALDELAEQQKDSSELPQVAGDADVATVMYTSGTTGFPKGVMRTHGANLWNVANSALDSPRHPHDLEFFTLPIFGIGFMHFALPTLLGGGCLLLDRTFDPQRTWDLIGKHRPTRIFLAPTMIDSMLAVPGGDRVDVSSLDVIYSAYEFPEPLRRRALQRFGDFFVYMYGLTEAQLTAAGVGDFAVKPTSAGKPMGLMRLRIVDPDGHPVPAGSIGEITLEGPAVMAGYLGLPDATAESLRDGWVYTGDLGYTDADGDVHFTGRKKEIIKTGGFTVDPTEVERRLFELADIREAAVVGVADEHWGEMVVAFVVAASGSTIDERHIQAHCREQLADYKVPKAVRVLDGLPKNPTGKIERGRLRTLWTELPG